MRFKIDWASRIVGRKFSVYALFYFVFEGSFYMGIQFPPILGLHCHAMKNKNVNHSIQKDWNLGNEKR